MHTIHKNIDVTNSSILAYSTTTNGQPYYKMATQTFTDGTVGLIRDTFSRNASVYDVWTAQFGIRYNFGN